MKLRSLALVAGALVAATTYAYAAGFFTNGVPRAGGSQYPNTIPLTGAETIPADTNLTAGLNPASEAITTAQLAGYAAQVGITQNGLIGGNFGTNLWQRGTTSGTVTTVATYTADRWWVLSGTGTAVTVAKQTSSLTPGFSGSARIQRTAAQTGVIPVCFGQVLTSGNSVPFQGKTVEFQFWAKVGATFSAASSNVTATIAYGTGTNESMANFTTGAWTGYTAAVAQTTTLSTAWSQYSAVAAIPSTATQIGVKICYTPVGTAGATDWFEVTGMQLDANASAVAKSSSTDTSYSIAAFAHRVSQQEEQIQLSFFYEIDESAAVTPIASCGNSTTSLALCHMQFPVAMRIIPTMTYTTGFAANTTTAMTALTACTTLATSTAVTSTAVNTTGVMMSCASSAAFGAAGTTSFLYSNGGSGKILASAEL